MNFYLLLITQAFNAIADALLSVKTVLPWLMQSLGVPPGLIGLLVPIRESGSMLPQLAIGNVLQSLARRKFAYSAGLAVQGLCASLIALVAVLYQGWTAGCLIVGLVLLLALARAVCSICSKDVLGKTVQSGRRGGLLGWSSAIAGGVSGLIGLFIVFDVLGSESNLVRLILIAALAWFVASMTELLISEPKGDTQTPKSLKTKLKSSLLLFRSDELFRRFVVVRAFLMSSALSAPYLVLLIQRESSDWQNSIQLLGILIVLSGAASFLSSPIWGRSADQSSRRVMLLCAALTAVLSISAAMLSALETAHEVYLLLGLFLLLSLVHQGVRIARKTYVVDIAEGNQRTDYVATSNSAIGLLLIISGAISALLAQISISLVLWVFAALLLAYKLPEAS